MLGNGVCDENCKTAECQFDKDDCVCQEGCVSTDFASCKLDCLNYKCEFALFGKAGGCQDSFALELALTHQAITRDPLSKFSWASCHSATKCEAAQLFSMWSDSQCQQASDSSGKYIPCVAEVCSYTLGLCTLTLHASCERGFGVSRNQCFKCKSGFVRLGTTCLMDCPRRYQRDKTFTELCVPLEDDSSEDNFDELFVYSSHGDGFGIMSFPYGNLEVALAAAWKRYTVIYLMGNTCKLSFNMTNDNPEIGALDSAFNPLGKSNFTILRIESLTCIDRVTPFCSHNYTKIDLILPITLNISFPIIISKVVFHNEALFDDLSVDFCPFLELIEGKWINVAGETASQDEIQASAVCAQFSSYSVFLVRTGGTLTMKVRDIQDVAVVNVTMRMRAFIEIQGGHVQLDRVDFRRVHTADGVKVTGGVILQSEVCNEAVCGSLSYRNGEVTHLNDGLDYVQNVKLSPFLYSRFLESVEITGVQFLANFVVEAYSSRTSTSASGLLYLENFYRFQLSHCTFQTNVVTGGLVLITSRIKLPYYATDGQAFMFQQDHIVLTDITAEGNLCENAVLWILFFEDMLNVDIEQLVLVNNAVEGKNIVTVESERDVTPSVVEGEVQSVVNPASGANENLFVASRHVNMKNVLITHSFSFATLIFFRNCANLQLKNITLADCGDKDQEALHRLFSAYSAESHGTISPELPPVVSCEKAFTTESSINLSIDFLEISEFVCQAGSCGLSMLGDTGLTTLSSVVATNSICEVGEGSVLNVWTNAAVAMSDIIVTNVTNLLGAVLYFRGYCKANITDSLFEDNIGQFGTVVYSESVLSTVVTRTVFRRNDCMETYGGVFYWWTTTQLPLEILVQDCLFEGNAAGVGGVFSLEVGSFTEVHLLIENCEFVRNRVEDSGAAFYSYGLTSFVGDSAIRNCTFRDHISILGIFHLVQNSGVLTFIDCEFARNIGTIVAAILIESSPEASIILENLAFLDNPAGQTILKANPRVNSTFETRNCTFRNNAKADVAMEGGYWIDSRSSFTFSTESEIFLSSQAVANITLSRFSSTHDKASGGTVHLMTASTFLCTACIFVNNSAGYSGGVLFLEQDSQTIMKNCTFRNNFAGSGGAVFYFTSSLERVSLIDSSVFEQNDGGVNGIIFVQTATFWLHNVTVRNNIGKSNPGIVMLISSAKVTDSHFEDMHGNFTTFFAIYAESSVSISNSLFEDGSSGPGGIIQVSSSSKITINTTTFRRMTVLEGGVISANVYCSVSLFSVTMSEIRSGTSGSLLYISESSLMLHNSHFSDYNTGGIFAAQLSIAELRHCGFQEGHGDLGGAAYFYQCESVSILDCEFHGNSANAGGALLFEALEEKTTASVLIQRSRFSNNQAASAGAIFAKNQKLSIVDSFFLTNAAEEGGAIFLSCTIASICNYTIAETMLANNTANMRGGGISWLNAKPKLMNLTFVNNSALYGPDVASYAIAITVDALVSRSRVLSTVTAAPGQVVQTAIEASVRDHYGQVVSTDNSSLGILEAVTPDAFVTGETKVIAVCGTFVFSNFAVIAAPNSTITLLVRASAVTESIQGDPDPHFPTVLLHFEMRPCIPGEYQSPGMCNLCDPGTFSFNPADPCQTCPPNAVCLGNMTMFTDTGYWRSNIYSKVIWECPNPQTCLGGEVDGKPLSLTGYCATGYKGNLCQSCEDGYLRTGKDKCGKCPARDVNIIRIVFIAVAILIVIILMVWSTMRSATRPAATHSILIRIFVNYLQLVLLVTEFKLSWPRPVLELFSSQESVGGSTEQAYSVDCFLSGEKAGSVMYYRKCVFMVLLPLPLIVGSIAFWLVVAAKRRNKIVMKRECAATVVILFFMILPNLVKFLFSMFSCREIEAGEYWLTVDLGIRCWDHAHNFSILAIGLPGILVWVIAVPFCCLGVLIKYRRRHHELWIKLQYGFLINGYRRRCFYWEFVVLYRKVLVIVCSVFLTNSIAVQALTVQLILLMLFFLHYNVNPYFLVSLNSVEAWAIIVADVTIYCGLYYLSAGVSEITSWILFVIIVIANVVFIFYWLYRLLGQVIDMVSKRVPMLGRFLQPGQFRDQYMEEFFKQVRISHPQAEVLGGMDLTNCYRRMLRQDVPDLGRSKYTPRSILPPSEGASDDFPETS